MKILHCCLASFYIDNYGYQENILPKMHKQQGYEVRILASTESYIDNKKLGYLPASSYLSETGIPVTRLPYIKWLPHKVIKKLRVYKGVKKYLLNFNPDIIFIHDLQFISILDISRYVKENNKVKVFVDGHTDFINSARNWVSKNVLHRIVYKWCAKIIEPYTTKFYGVLPLRVDFIHQVYGIPKSKIELLELGADDSVYDVSKRDIIKTTIRKKLDINENDILLITGGKIDERKKIHQLLKTVNQIHRHDIKIIVFGQANLEMENELDELSSSPFVRYLGWLQANDIYDYLIASDLGFFPGTHSILWEQAVGVGLPCVFRKWDRIQHIDLGGNCKFINDSELETIKNSILSIVDDPDSLNKMREIAMTKGVNHFSYSKIARRAII
jgi:1,2-diacylglycerol 3-alpha-glucosyltransferase